MKLLLSTLVTLCLVVGCSSKDEIIVGTIAGPETKLMEVATSVAEKDHHLKIKLKTFSDYVIPNIALNDGSIDANVYQHQPYLDNVVKSRGYQLVAIGKTFIYPMAIYSNKLKHLSDLSNGATVALPNDPSNEARALLLLQKAGLVKVSKGTLSSVRDIQENPKQLVFKPLAAAQLPRSLSDVDIAVINTNYAMNANLSPSKNGLFIEGKQSQYANLIVVRKKDLNNPKLLILVKSLHSQAVIDEANRLFKGEAIQAW